MEEIPQTMEVYFSIYFNLFLDIQLYLINTWLYISCVFTNYIDVFFSIILQSKFYYLLKTNGFKITFISKSTILIFTNLQLIIVNSL